MGVEFQLYRIGAREVVDIMYCTLGSHSGSEFYAIQLFITTINIKDLGLSGIKTKQLVLNSLVQIKLFLIFKLFR